MFRKFYFLFFISLYSVVKVVNLSEAEDLRSFILVKTVNINDYIDSCFLKDEDFLDEDCSNQEINKKLNHLISKLFFFSSKISLESKYVLNLDEIQFIDNFKHLNNLLNLILNYSKESDYSFLSNSIIDIFKKKENVMHLFLTKTKTQNDKLEFQDIFKKFLDDLFDLTKKYFYIYFNEILPFFNLQDTKFCLTSNLNFLEIDINENVNIKTLKKNYNYFYRLSDPLIVVEFYVKQIKYFLNNLIFLSILKKNILQVSDENQMFFNQTFYENLKNFFNASFFSFCALGQYLQCFNLNEFLGVRKTGNFFNYKNDLQFSDVEDFSCFFFKLVEIYDKNISIFNFNEFDIDNFINFIVRLNDKKKYPKDIINILNFIFSYDAYRSDFYTNEEKFLYNDEKKGVFKIDEKLENINDYNFNVVNNLSCKNTKKQLYKPLNFEQSVFFRFDNGSFDILNKKCYLGIGYKVNKENFFLGLNFFCSFSFFSFSISYFFKNNIVFSGFIKFYKSFFISFSFSNDKKIYFGLGYFLDIKDVFLDVNFNFYF